MWIIELCDRVGHILCVGQYSPVQTCGMLLVWGMQVLSLITADPGKLPLVGSTSGEKQKWRKSVQVRSCAHLTGLVCSEMT